MAITGCSFDVVNDVSHSLCFLNQGFPTIMFSPDSVFKVSIAQNCVKLETFVSLEIYHVPLWYSYPRLGTPVQKYFNKSLLLDLLALVTDDIMDCDAFEQLLLVGFSTPSFEQV